MNATRKVRIGILGGGGILGAHAPAFATVHDLCEVAAVAEPKAGNADRIRKLLGHEVRILPDYRDVLADDSVDAVDILLPHDLHMPATVAAAQAGKHVLVEKVMARNIYECDRMIEACDAAGVSLTVCHDRRYHGQWLALKQIVDSAALGEIYSWRLDHTQNVLAPENSWIRDRNALGGGAIMSCLTHQIDALRWYGGEVRAVTGMAKVIPGRMQGEAIGAVIAQMESGALAELYINWMTRCNTAADGLWYEMVHVVGSKGEAYYMSNRGTFLLLYDADAPAPAVGYESRFAPSGLGFRKVRAGDWSGHQRCIHEWVKLLRGEPAEITTSGRDVRGSVEVAEAAYLSVQSGRTISLPIPPEPWSSL